MNTIIIILNIIGILYGLWFALIAVLGSLRGYAAPEHCAPKTRFAVLIPARNEENVVGHLVESLMAQDYPRELYDVVVIPNGCTDDTAAVARRAGAKVLMCDVPTHSKGDVLRFAFDRLPQMGDYDAYCVLDADNLAAPGFLSAANDMMLAGWRVAQGRRDSKNPSDSWVAGDTSMFFWIMNRFYNRARSALGMSAALNGTGIVMTRELIDEMGWDMRSLTEDLEFSGLCAAKGVKIGYMDAAVIYDEQPIGLIDSMVQRRRWFSGGMQCLRIHFSGLIRRHSLHCIDMLCVFGGCVMQVLCFIPGIYTVYGIISGLIAGTMSVRLMLIGGLCLMAAAYLGCALFAYLLCRIEGKMSARRVPAVLMFPIFLVTWVPANIWAMVTKPPKWKHIDHVRATDKPE